MENFRPSFPARSAGPAIARPPHSLSRKAFTLIELLVVIAIIAILAAILLPVLSAAKVRGEAALSLANTRQLTTAGQLYAGDNNDYLVSYKNWVLGSMDWLNTADNTNQLELVGPMPAGQAQPMLGPYVKNPKVYKSPADTYQSPANPGPRVRSYSMNGALGGGNSGPTAQGTTPGNRQYYAGSGSVAGMMVDANKMTDLRAPSDVFVVLEEQADSLNDGAFMFDPGYTRGQEHWRDLPASYYDDSDVLSFADCHSEIHRWLERRYPNTPIYPVLMKTYAAGQGPWTSPSMASRDYEWMDDHMPYGYK